MKRIGIMGGTFNPIHNGHLAIAETARKQFLLEKVLFMPSGVPYKKNLQEVLPVEIRCEMTALAITDMPHFELSTLEALDAAHGKNTYTYKTLQKLRSADPEADYYFILGADSLFSIENWKKPALIFENCKILVAVRGNKTALQDQVLYLREKYHASVEIMEFEGIDVSSTQIRKMIQKGESLQMLIPKAVERYLLENELY